MAERRGQGLSSSLRRNGQYRALVVRESTGEVLAGNHTLLAMRELGWKKALVHFVDVDAAEARRIVLADNRTADLGGYDDEALATLLRDLGGDALGTGWDSQAIDRLLASVGDGGAGRDTEPSEPPSEPRTKPGDLYTLGEHRLLCGDATVKADVEKLMGGDVAEMVFTDPPYGVDYEGGRNPVSNVARERLAADRSGTSIYADALAQIVDVTDKQAPLYLWFAGTQGAAVYAAVEGAGFAIRALIVWHKLNAHYGAFMAQYMPKHEPLLYCVRGKARWHGPTNEVSVWEHDQPATSPLHPTQKPPVLAERAIGNSSAEGAIVLDLFAGSGSTLIACENLGRRCFAMEIDPGYVDVCVDRWERHTGRRAVKT